MTGTARGAQNRERSERPAVVTTSVEFTAGRGKNYPGTHGRSLVTLAVLVPRLSLERELPVGPVDNVRKAPVEMPASLSGDVAEWLKAAVC